MNKARAKAPMVDPAIYCTTGKEYVQADADGTLHVIVKSAELAGTNWNTYVGGTGRWRWSSSEHKTLKAARAHIRTVSGWGA